MAAQKPKKFQRIEIAENGDETKIYVKPGWKTSEFWVFILTMIATNTSSLAEVLDPRWAAVATAVSGCAYAISRGLAKR